MSVVAWNKDSLRFIPHVLVMVTIAVTKRQNPSNLGRRGLIWITLQITHHHRRKSGKKKFKQSRNLEAGADARAVEGACPLACSLRFAQCAFLQNPEPSSPERAPPTVGWALLHQTLRKCPTGLSTTGLWKHFFF